MPKIRDLGIKAIPATMRPPEIGAGGAVDILQCCTNCTPEVSCNNSVQPPKPAPEPGPKKYGYELGADAVATIRKQLDEAISRETVN